MVVPRRRFLNLLVGGAVVAGCPRLGMAQSYPVRPVRVIVPFAPGGQTDVVARLVAQKLSDRLGKQFYVENAAGGGGNIGVGRAAQAEPDGHSILFVDGIGFAANPALYATIPYDPIADFEPVCVAATTMQVLAVNPSVPANTVQELVALIKASPGKFSYASAGEYLSLLTQSKMVHVPYRSSPAALNDLLAGNLDINFQSMPAVRSFVDSPRLKMLAVLSSERLKELPDVPTMAETEFPDFVLSSWMGLFGPAGLPPDIRQRLSDALVKVGRNPELQARIRGAGIEPVGSDAGTFTQFADAEGKKWKTFIDRTGIKLNP